MVKQHKDAVYRQMVRACGNYDDAEDVLVEALLAAYRALPTIRDEEAFRAWLAVVGRRVCSRIQRHAALRPVLSLSGLSDGDLEIPDARADAGAASESQDLAACVKSAIAELPDGLREVYVRREIQGNSADETSSELGITVAAQKSRLHRARAVVRRALDSKVCAP